MHWLAAFNTLLFISLAGVHGYWALGGQRGLVLALPADAGGRLLLRPSAGLTAAVALSLLAMASLSAAYLALVPNSIPNGLRLAMGGLALLLALRALGDFRYVGLSKRVRHTTFARLDTRYYTPLCGLLAASCAALALAV